jgi:hypothetical protein
MSRQLGDGWLAVHEAFGVAIVCSVEHLLTLREDTWSAAKVHLRGREPFDAAVPMRVVVPRKEYLAVASRLIGAAVKAVWKARPVFYRRLESFAASYTSRLELAESS